MPQAVFEIVASSSQFDRLPFTISQRSSRTSALILLMLLVPALCMLVGSVGLLVVFLEPVLGLAADHPGAALQVVVGLSVWTLLFAVPAKRVIQRFGISRQVEFHVGGVIVKDTGPFGSHSWRAPLAEFRGIAHVVRASLSGLRHELVLVHADKQQSVLLCTANQISQSTIEGATRLLGLPEIPAREVYRATRSGPARTADSHVIEQPIRGTQVASA